MNSFSFFKRINYNIKKLLLLLLLLQIRPENENESLNTGTQATTVFCKIPVRRSTNITGGKLKTCSRRLFHSCTIFEAWIKDLAEKYKI